MPLAVVKRPGRTVLYLRGTVQNRRVFESTGTRDPKLAEEIRSARETELNRAAIYGEKPRVDFAAAAESYLRSDKHSRDTQLRVIRVVKHFGDKVTCDQIDQAAVDKAASRICRIGSSPATKLREVVTPIKAVLMHASRRGWVAPPVFEKVKAAGKRTDWLTPAEAERLIAAAEPHLAPLLVFLFCTGARPNEAYGLEWSDVDLEHGRANLRDTKNGEDRLADLPPRAVAALAAIQHREGRVFLKPGGEPYRLTQESKTMSYGGQTRKGFATARKGAGITRNLTAYHARHTWASWHYAVHKDLLKLRQDGGWKSAALVERYAKLIPDGLKVSVLAFWTGNGKSKTHTVSEAS